MQNISAAYYVYWAIIGVPGAYHVTLNPKQVIKISFLKE